MDHSSGWSWQVQGHAFIAAAARFGCDLRLVTAGTRADGIVGPADHPFNGFRFAFGAGHIRLFVRAHEELFKNLAAGGTPEFKNGHCFTPIK
jgi:hypothetical protein